ncbi:guanylate kinase [Actinocorallia sp. B10E7]|uniref:guanylate kinase n=1 Tax=Actinocorallia sp. B10E7 TaxID=3153558 RepID=UPI00325D7739
MNTQGVILYGPPTSGKDTITDELTRRESRFLFLPKLKAGFSGPDPGRGHRLISFMMMEALERSGALAVVTNRHRDIYAVDRQGVEDAAASGRVPVIHMDDVADLTRLREAVPITWLTVLLWTPREVCAERPAGRGDDTADRLQAWDETRADLGRAGTGVFDLEIRTDEVTAAEAAHQIITAALPQPPQPAE